jgi:hypothetical protein
MKVGLMLLFYRDSKNNLNLVGNGKTVTVVEADEFDRSFAFTS